MKKYLLLLFLIVFVQHFSFGQSGNWLWARQATGIGTVEGISTATDVFGNVYATGSFYSSTITFDSITLTCAGQRDMFLVKYSPTGAVIWAKSAGGPLNDQGCSVTIDESNDIYITGYFKSPTIIFDSDTLYNPVSSNMFLVKYSQSGTVLWAKSGEGSSTVVGNSVTFNSLGNVCVTGYFSGTGHLIFGNDTLTNVGNTNIYVVEYSTSGTTLWAKSAGGTGSSKSNYIATDAFGNIFITGEFDGLSISFGTTTLLNSGGTDIFIAKYSDTGSFIWGRIPNGTGYELGNCIATDFSGNIYVTGGFYSPALIFDTDTLINSGDEDMFIVKYSSSGTVLFAKAVGSTVSEDGWGLVTDISGNVFVSGGFTSPFILFDSDTLYFPGVSLPDPMFLVKYDSSLNVICTTALASGGDDWTGLSTDVNGNLYVSGDFATTPFIVGVDTLAQTQTGSETFFIAKYNCQTSLSVNELPNQEIISIFPNPISSEFTISSTENEIKEIKIIDVLGNEIKRINISSKQITIEKGNMNSGIYFVQITDEKKTVVNKKIIIQ